MKTFQKLAFVTTAATYLVIFTGGLVRVSGAGLGCPDWPTCFGRWIPPFSVSQLPAHIDPAQFNFVLAWTEYMNRLAGVMLGLLILGTTVMAIKHFRHVPKILYTTIASLLLVMYQGWQGGQLVAHELEPFLVSVHMGLALVLVSLLIYVTQQAYYYNNPEAETTAEYPGNADKWIAVLWIATLVQIVLGTGIRAGVEALEKQFPLLSEQALLNKLGASQHIHWLLGIVMFIVTWRVGAWILKSGRDATPLVRKSVIVMILLVFGQLFIGIVLVSAGLPPLFQLFHLWIASFYTGVLLLLFNAIKKSCGGTHAAS